MYTTTLSCSFILLLLFIFISSFRMPYNALWSDLFHTPTPPVNSYLLCKRLSNPALTRNEKWREFPLSQGSLRQVGIVVLFLILFVVTVVREAFRQTTGNQTITLLLIFSSFPHYKTPPYSTGNAKI